MLEVEYERELKFFRQFHQNKINLVIHSICIPVEWFSWLIIIKYIHSNLPWLISISVAIYYLLIQQKRIIYLASFAHILFALMIDQLFIMFSRSYLWIAALIFNLISWAIQILIGHYYFEKNSPGMATKLTLNSIVLSVLLCWDH
jgi:uncharacterized membrane protein YGL010W